MLSNATRLMLLSGFAAAAIAHAADLDSVDFRTDAIRSMHAIQADDLRLRGAAAATNLLAGAFFTPRAGDEWRRLLGGRLSSGADGWGIQPVLVEDFLRGASCLLGPYDAHGAVFAYWNPYWDALLFVRTGGGELPEPRRDASGAATYGSSSREAESASDLLLGRGQEAAAAKPAAARGKPPMVEQFAWLDGDTFRGVQSATNGGESYSARLWRRETATTARFREIHPASAADAPVLFSDSVANADQALVRPAIGARAARRLAEIGACVKKPVNAVAVNRCAKLLQDAGREELLRAFDSPGHDFFCRQLDGMPGEARKGFAPYGAIESPEGALFIFVNSDMPRFYATVSFPREALAGKRVEKRPVQMEWYDLATAEQLLDAVGGGAGKPDGEVAPVDMSALATPGGVPRSAPFAAAYAMRADAMRLSGLASATNFPAAANMTPEVSEEWGRMLSGGLDGDADGLPPVLAEDFLAGANIMMGPCAADGAVFAYWNPFWDMLLFVRTVGGELPRTEQFLWVGGKAFRGERGDGGKGKKSFSETLWLREAGTVRRFREIYPETDGMAFSKGIPRIDPGIAAVPKETTREELRTAARLRQKMIEACFRNGERKSKAFRGAEFLRRSSSDDLVSAFDSFKTRPFCRRFAMLDPAVRRGFALYGCLECEGESPDAMLVFVNTEMPRLYATALFPKGMIDALYGSKYQIQFEWYDLARADKLPDATGALDSASGVDGGAR